jgi:general secretion pathway protein J
MSAACGRRGSGFTLLELLVALAILALLSLLGYRAVASLTDSEVRLSEETQRWRTIDALFVRIEADLREAVPRNARMGGGVAAAWIGVTDAAGNTTLEFSRAGPEFAPDVGAAGQRLAYRFDRGGVEVLYWPYLDNAPNAVPTIHRLVDNVAGFRVSYLDRAGAWRDRWPVAGEAAIPRAVRVELTLASGEPMDRWWALR